MSQTIPIVRSILSSSTAAVWPRALAHAIGVVPCNARMSVVHTRARGSSPASHMAHPSRPLARGAAATPSHVHRTMRTKPGCSPGCRSRYFEIKRV